MLRELHLSGLGVIGDVSVELSPGLNVVTGETGVGKTLLVTSLALLAGARGSSRLVPDGANEAVVQAVVSVPDALRGRLDDLGVDADDDLILVRRLASDGRSRAWAGGRLIGVSTLAEIGADLVEIHGQGDGPALARPARQLAAIDALAANEEVLRSYRTALEALRALEREEAGLRADEAARRREVDLLSHQVEEVERAGLEAGEEDRVHEQLRRLEHAEKLGAIASEVLRLAGADGAAGDLADAHGTLESAARIDDEASPLVARLGGLAAEASELARDIRVWSETLEGDPAQLDALRERKALIASLKRKYGGDLDDILDAVAGARTRLEELATADDRIGQIASEIDAARRAVADHAAELTARRRSAAERATELVSAELPALALEQATFTVEHTIGEPTENGSDRIAFLFSSTRALAPQPIGKVASGGELSRAMIAVTLALATAHPVPVLVFDEADQGLGGSAALELGRRLARLGGSHQVLVVSHLPQIAAFAARHIVVRREGDEVTADALVGDDRRAEVSRMLAGLEGSDLARGHAEELLDLARREREELTAAGAGGQRGT